MRYVTRYKIQYLKGKRVVTLNVTVDAFVTIQQNKDIYNRMKDLKLMERKQSSSFGGNGENYSLKRKGRKKYHIVNSFLLSLPSSVYKNFAVNRGC